MVLPASVWIQMYLILYLHERAVQLSNALIFNFLLLTNWSSKLQKKHFRIKYKKISNKESQEYSAQFCQYNLLNYGGILYPQAFL